jgi:preprotein translocase subunit SecG
MTTFFIVTLSVLSIFMILLILIQRGKGGGLAGAFGGMGGQSAFGTKAGDTFTKITVVTAIIWFLACVGVLLCLKQGIGSSSGDFGSGEQPPAAAATAADSATDSAAPTTTPSPVAPTVPATPAPEK